MKVSNILKITAVTFLLSAFSINTAFAKDLKVATVDVMQVVQKSPKINALKTERQNKTDDLLLFVKNARAGVEKETDPQKKKALEDKYNKELNLKKNAVDKEYAEKLSVIDKDITALIESKAKELGYDLVLSKNSVLSGGTEITSEIIKGLK